MRAVFLQMLLPTAVILKHTKKEFIWRPISAYFAGLIAFKKKQRRLTLAQKKGTKMCLAEQALVSKYRVVFDRRKDGFSGLARALQENLGKVI